MINNKQVGTFRNMINNIDQNVRRIIFLLNQSGYNTFTSDQGDINRLPKFGIVIEYINDLMNIISTVEKYHGNIWYEISNRWYKKENIHEDEINFTNDINLEKLNLALDLEYKNVYFIVFKAKTLKELDDFAKFLINNR